MSDSHLTHLSLGSNIQPETNLVRAIQLLQKQGHVEKISSAWESESVGAAGPNYLNACVSFVTGLNAVELKEQILFPIETELGRIRTADRFAPRTMDIDIVLYDNNSSDDKYWEQAFVVVPLAEIHPDYRNPLTNETLIETAARLRRDTWLEARREVLAQYSGGQFTA